MVKNRGAVVEDGDGAVSLAPGVVLVGKSGARTHFKVAVFPPKTPYDLSRVAIYLVDGEGLASGDEQVIVVIYFYGIGVEVVEPRAPILRHRGIALIKTYMLDAMPFEEHLAALDIKLLNDSLPHPAVLQATDRGEIPEHRAVDQDQRGVLGTDEELMVVPVAARQGTEPLHLPAIVDDHRAALPSEALLRSDEGVAGGCVVRLLGHLDGGRAEVGARAEDPYVLLVGGRGTRQGRYFRGRRGAPAPVAAHHVCQG